MKERNERKCGQHSPERVEESAHNWYPSMAITAIVPSCEIHNAHPWRRPTFSSSSAMTRASGVVKNVHRAQSLSVLERVESSEWESVRSSGNGSEVTHISLTDVLE